MEEKHLHIITHDVPFPADFGGVVDLFYKIKTLHSAGIKIHLHCFLNKRPEQKELEKYCVSVNYYKRKTGIGGLSFRLPFIVSSRKSSVLINDLQKDNYPVLIEGIHCSYYLYSKQVHNRKVLLRLHNTEFEYYHHLAKNVSNPFKKLYFFAESKLLKKYEKKIGKNIMIAAVSSHDVELYKRHFNASYIFHLPVFLPDNEVKGIAGKGPYCLYHGNLSISENEEAVIWLLKNVFSELKIPFVIAGKDPSPKLERLAHAKLHTCLVANPGDAEMQDMIAKAHINILPSFNNTGVKLKLLNALYNGRHCVVNKAGVEGSGLESLCSIATNASSFKTTIAELYNQEFTDEQIQRRRSVLQSIYDNNKNVEIVIGKLWNI